MGEPTASGTVEGGTLTTQRDAQVALDLCEGALQPRKAHRVSRIDGFTIVTGHFGGFGSQTTRNSTTLTTSMLVLELLHCVLPRAGAQVVYIMIKVF